MAAEVSEVPRIDVLARHKPVPAGFTDDRRSVYWVDKEPLSGPTKFATTARLDTLSASKSLHSEFKWNRDRTFHVDWEPFLKEITPAHPKHIPEVTPRVSQLSSHKRVVQEYAYDRDLPVPVSRGAMSSSSSARLDSLAKPKECKPDANGVTHPFRFWNDLPRNVSRSAMRVTATARLELLSEAKKFVAGFVPEKPVESRVQSNTLQAVATTRVLQLSRPNSRVLAKSDAWDPYLVTRAARNAQITPRIEELAVPMPRKVRRKKAAAAMA